MIRVLLVGDPKGAPDEGMKIIGRKLEERLSARDDVEARLVSVAQALRGVEEFADPDLVHYIAGPTWRSLIYCWLIQKRQRSGPRSIMTFIHPHWSKAADVAYRMATPDAAIVQSRPWLEYCHRRGTPLVSSTPLSGVDLGKFRPVGPEERAEVRARLGIARGERVVLHVGHLNRGRNLTALALLAGQPDVTTMVIGSTTVAAESAVLDALKGAGVRVIREYLPRIQEYYQAADCYVFPTTDPDYSVQVPLSVLEALACGLPVVSTPFEGLPLYLPEVEGLTYLQDWSRLPDVVAEILSCNVRPDHGVVFDFSWDAIVDSLVPFYLQVAGRGTG